jgi:hypothetical protein
MLILTNFIIMNKPLLALTDARIGMANVPLSLSKRAK